jgi:predicted nucleotidyltransferase component of viral defense system
MSTFDPSLFADVADAVRLPSPAFIEKDYFAVQLLKVISEIQWADGKLIFSGGTCLNKAHFQTYRMSEDLDLKFIPNEKFHKLSDSKKRKNRSNFGDVILQTIDNSNVFSLIQKESKNEGRYRCLSVNYPKTYRHNSLRPELKLEFTEIAFQHLPSLEAPISSIYSEVTKQHHEITSLTCDHINIIMVEKFLGLLRRTAEVNRGHAEIDDEEPVN